jgi:predicted TIM-barrel fold metal-dependent hydrolase
MGYSVLVNHAHVSPSTLNPDGTIERLLKMLDACEIDQAVCFAPFPHNCDGKNIEPNSWLAGELKKHDRLFGFGTIDVRRRDMHDQAKKIADLGLLGIKLHPNGQSFDILDPKLFELYAAAQELNLFVTFHTGVHHSRLVQNRVINFDEIAWNFPHLRFSMEHVGGYSFFHEALAVIFNHVPPPWIKGKCNVFAGLTSIFTNYTRMWYLGNERIKELAAQVGVNQLIFGLDFPYNLEEATKTGLETIRSLFTPAEQELILGGNLRRELGLAEK